MDPMKMKSVFDSSNNLKKFVERFEANASKVGETPVTTSALAGVVDQIRYAIDALQEQIEEIRNEEN
ncbi:hypothetical protein P3T73_13715 [Kiritimatiellota bacterium B12222]|nr:hypothetical protein P3T73_13715 [Kiritimatiellota bacterium B12222]